MSYIGIGQRFFQRNFKRMSAVVIGTRAYLRDLIVPDYLLHIVEYLFLGFLMCRAIKNTKENLPLRKVFILSIVLVVLYAASDELHQMFVPGRYASLVDLFCDGIGATIGAKISL